jgi:uncharacterized protein
LHPKEAIPSSPFLICSQTNQALIADRAAAVFGHLDRMRGLLGRRSMPIGEALLILPCKAVHSWFMAFPIDVVFLDRDYRVVHVISNLAPFRMSPVVTAAYSVLELPAGTAAKCQVRVGTQLKFRPREESPQPRRLPRDPSKARREPVR